MWAIWFVVTIPQRQKKGMAMQKRLTKKDRFFHNINLTVDDDVYVGIDVHKKNCHIAIWLNEAIALTFVTPSDNVAIAHTLGRLTPGLVAVVLCRMIFPVFREKFS